jgi:hypothetical protein
MSNLTYNTLSGKKQPRRFAIAALFILAIVLAAFVWSRYQHKSLQNEVLATPKPLAGELPTETQSPADIPATPTVTAEPCPADPQDWQLVDMHPNDNLKAIQPACVYDGLATIVGWQLLTRLGYSGPEVNGILGFLEIPVGAKLETIPGMTSTKGPLQIPLTHDVFHPAYQVWLLGEGGIPSLAASLRGCFRSQSVVGNQVEDWGSGYAVICMVALDRSNGWIIHQLGNQVFTSPIPALRQFYLIGYRQTAWKLIGAYKDLYTLIDEPETFAADRETHATRTGASIWDIAWIETQYGLGIKPLPENWKSANDPAVLENIVTQLRESTP